MAIQFEVRPEIADKLTALAKARGVSVDELLLALLSPEPSETELAEPSLEEFERDMDALAEEDLDQLPTEYRGTYSRADIYADHD